MRSTKIKKNFRSSSLWTCLHHMAILGSQNKITDFLMILAWDCPFKLMTLCHQAFSESLLNAIQVITIVALCKLEHFTEQNRLGFPLI